MSSERLYRLSSDFTESQPPEIRLTSSQRDCTMMTLGRCLRAFLMSSIVLLLNVQSQPIQLVNAFPNLTFTKPVFLTHSHDGTNRIFVVQQNGLIRVFPNDSAVTSYSTFLDVSSRINASSGEEGLLGLAFHPQYKSNGYFYVNYTAPNPRRTVVAKYSVDPSDPNRADPLSEVKILEIDQPFSNHNGGMLMFGHDGCLYIGTGDGGSGGDPYNNAQNPGVLLGKMLRINVDSTEATMNYSIPSDNPFKGNTQGYREEIWAWGLRNPWRFSQDPVTGEIWVGDVGQNEWEEVDLLQKGANYGWRITEGTHCYNPPSGCDMTGITPPVKEYSHASNDCSITGGYVYRGKLRPDLVGAYVYGDYCTGRIWELRYGSGRVTSDSLLIRAPFQISSFGTDQENELYICSYSNGAIYRFARTTITEGYNPDRDIPAKFILGENYPNPFNPLTTIPYELPRSADVVLKVSDILGREVATLVDEYQQAGQYRFLFDASNLSTGAYIYELRAGPFTDRKKMILVR
jgi:glucose/arabinose dehydrogenase